MKKRHEKGKKSKEIRNKQVQRKPLKCLSWSVSLLCSWPWGYHFYHVKPNSAGPFNRLGLNLVWCLSQSLVLLQASVPLSFKQSSKAVRSGFIVVLPHTCRYFCIFIWSGIFWCRRQLLGDENGCMNLCLSITVTLIIALSGPCKTMSSSLFFLLPVCHCCTSSYQQSSLQTCCAFCQPFTTPGFTGIHLNEGPLALVLAPATLLAAM